MRIESAADVLLRHVAAGTFTGGVLAVGRGRDELDVVSLGRADLEGAPMSTESIFRIQSMTKAVVAAATLRAVQEGALSLDDPVDRWLPELADRPVLRTPTSPLDETVPADGPIRVRHLLTCTSGIGVVDPRSPLGEAMERDGTDAGPAPSPLGADEWLSRLAAHPLVGHPGAVWRYHHSFALLGILLARRAGTTLEDHLRRVVLDPLGMPDTGSWVPEDERHRLVGAYRLEDGRLVEVEPAAGGPYAGTPPVDVSHGELVSTASDYAAFLAMLVDGRAADGSTYLSDGLRGEMVRDQVDPVLKTPGSFAWTDSFWDGLGWGYGGAVVTEGEQRGMFSWSGGAGTDFALLPDGRFVVQLTQTEMCPAVMPAFGEVQAAALGTGG